MHSRTMTSTEILPAGIEATKNWSLVDCISFVVMRQRRLTDALTRDGHFEQAGIRALLK